MEKLDALAALTTDYEKHKKRTIQFFNSLPQMIKKESEVIETFGKIGSGAYPTYKAPTVVIKIKPTDLSVYQIAKRLRKEKTPVFTYIDEDALFIDLKTVSVEEETLLRESLINSF